MSLQKALLVAVIVVPSISFAQWPNIKFIGVGGEPNLAADSLGHVYLTCHQEAKFFVSNDWGANYFQRKSFSDSCCDLNVVARPNGRVLVTYVSEDQDGIKNWTSPDFGTTMVQGSSPTGPLDREWTNIDLSTGNAYMVYSKGFVGGPLSQGIYCAKSLDLGLNFVEMSRCDDEVLPALAVDPYLASSLTGRIYSMWSVSTDNNSFDKFKFSYSVDGGLTFTGHKTLATLHRSLGTTQERWMFGGLVAAGPSKVCAFYSDYEQVTVDGTVYTPLLAHYTLSTDGGVTFSQPATVSSPTEIADAIRSFRDNKLGDVHYPYYIQTLPSATIDPFGRMHVVYQDNRDGQTLLNGQPYDMWHVRHASGWVSFGTSDRVSPSVRSLRPPLDFVSVAADSKYLYASWVELPDSTLEWVFTGNLYVARISNSFISPIIFVVN